MCIIKYFLNIISPGNDMLSKMQSLFAEYPEVDLRALGFPSVLWRTALNFVESRLHSA